MQELETVLRRAERGDLSVLPELRRLLDETPRIWRMSGDLGQQAEAALVKLAGGNNLLLCESLMRKLAEMKDELAGPAAPPLERLLGQRVALTWLQLSYFDTLLAQAAGAGEARLRVIQQQQDAASRRHLAAVKMLATIRKLLAPVATPLQIATTLARKDQGGRLRVVNSPECVGVEN